MFTSKQSMALLLFLQGLSFSSASRSLTSHYGSSADDDCVDTYSGCRSYVRGGYCPTYFCATCTYSNYCDASCGYCDTSPVPAPTLKPTNEPTTEEYKNSCHDTYDYCASYVTNGCCDSYFCDTCTYPDYCDKSCGYCEGDDDTPPAPAPTQDPTCHDSYGYCSSYVSSGYCPSYFCDTCPYPDYCDKSCGYCESDDDTAPVPAPVPAPTAGDGSCKDTYGYCSSYVSSGYCSTYFCDTCYYPDYCDKSCGYCESDDDTPPAPAPTEDPTCHDTYGYCSSYVSSGYCPVYFCDTCAYSDYCDKSCGYCEGDDDTPPAPAPVPAPVPAPTPQPTIADDSSCKDTYNYCSSYVTNGYCPTYFCDTCGYPNYCDKSCGYCESDDDTPPAPAPTQDPTCHDSYAYCSSYVNGGYCPTYFCDTCAYSDYCDKSCGYCDDDTPAPVPTAQPPTTSNDDDDDDDGGGRTCFSGQETVLKENGQKVTFNKLVIGDMILSANRDGKTSYSPVVFLPHGENDTPTTFLEIVTSKMKKLKMTRGHLIQLCSGKLVSAQHLSMKPTILISKKDKDDYNCIRTVDGNEKIKDIRIVQSKGVYTAVTESEFLVVNGIIASPFAASSGLVHAYFNLTDIEEWCSSNNWLVYERLRHPQLINIHNKKKKTGLEKEEGEEQSQELVSPSMDCMDMLTNMFEQYKNEPIGWGKDGWGYKGWANPASLHKNMNEHLNTNDEVLLKGAQLLPPPLASPETLKKHAMPELITGWDLKEGEYMPNEEMV